MKLIYDRHGRTCVLGERTAEPEAWWKQIQSIPCTDNPNWFSAYPLSGGAVNVQEGTFRVLRDANAADIELSFRRCVKGGSGQFNPAADTVLRLWDQEQLLTKSSVGSTMTTSTDDKEQEMEQRKKAKLIRQAVQNAGYSFYCTYNDKRKNNERRLKCMQNGFDHGKKQYDKWEKKINAELTKLGVEVISSGFEVLNRPGYGDYVAYVARFK